jgi:hypothetical protein
MDERIPEIYNAYVKDSQNWESFFKLFFTTL